MTPFGATKKPLTLTEGRLGLTHRRPNFPPTGTHPSPRSASVWRSMTTSLSLLLSTSRRTPCTLWSLMGSTAEPHLVVTHGNHWLVLRPPCSPNVTRKDSMLLVQFLNIPKPGSVSLVTTPTLAIPVTLELGWYWRITWWYQLMRKRGWREAHQGNGIYFGAVKRN